MAAENIKVLMVEPGKYPYVKEFPHTLENLQKAVDGYIEMLCPYEDPVALVCDEEGKLKGSTLNRALRDETNNIFDIIAGTFFVVGVDDSDFVSLSDEFIQKYTEFFKYPERFTDFDGKIVITPILPEPEEETKRMVTIYQINDSSEGENMRFKNSDFIKRHGGQINVAFYDKVYEGRMGENESLEDVFTRFNINHPAGFKGHSLSVSDVVVIHENGKSTAHFVDSFGFKEILDFFEPVKEKKASLDGQIRTANAGKPQSIAEKSVEKDIER